MTTEPVHVGTTIVFRHEKLGMMGRHTAAKGWLALYPTDGELISILAVTQGHARDADGHLPYAIVGSVTSGGVRLTLILDTTENRPCIRARPSTAEEIALYITT